MAYTPSKGVKVSPLLLVASSSATLILFVLRPSLTPSSSRPSSSPDIADVGGRRDRRMPEQIVPTSDDIKWLLSQIHDNSLPDPSNTPQGWHSLRKGINPRTRQQHLDDLLRFKGISHYDDAGENHTALPCPGELLVEEHHSNYGSLGLVVVTSLSFLPLPLLSNPLILYWRLVVALFVSVSTSSGTLIQVAIIASSEMNSHSSQLCSTSFPRRGSFISAHSSLKGMI